MWSSTYASSDTAAYSHGVATVLVVEDDDKIGTMLAAALTTNGHTTIWQRTGASALSSADSTRYDLVLLDLGLPDMDGVDVCRGLKLRQPASVVVMLTARREEMDVVVGLESGADDYLVKPFRMTELLARIRAHLRRATPPKVDGGLLEHRDLVVDVTGRRCLVRDREVYLRPKEFDLLARLLSSAGQALSRTQLMSDVWDENWFGSTKTLDVHIASLRQRLNDAANAAEPPAEVPVITTLRGHGYRLEADQGQV
jgi:DNA-binding response OmpR family regulator